MIKKIATKLSGCKGSIAEAVKHLPRSATVHAIAAARHLAQGNYLEALVSICLAIASFRHR